MKRNIISIGMFFLMVFFIFSCVPSKKYRYLRQNKKDTVTNRILPPPQIYRIHTGDLLYIRVFTLEEKTTLLFNPIETNLSAGVNEQSTINLNSYTVNDSGYVIIPLIGKIFLNNLTLDQAQDTICKKLKTYVSSADVLVKLLSFKIIFLGEFTKPGVYNVYSGKLNILEAIGMAGDFTIYGDKSKLMVIRQLENNKVYNIDLTERSIIYSNYFYLKPNDIIIAEPTKNKRQSTNYSIISTISLFLTSVINIIFLINYLK